MYIIVVGCGRTGYHLTRALLAMGHEVLVVERDPQRCAATSDELGSVAFRGDGTDARVLKKVGASRADVVIAVASRDEDNLAACQIAKHLFHTPKTIALVKDPRNENLFRLLGVDVSINRTHQTLSIIEEEIPGHPLVHLMNLKSLPMELVSINIPPDAAAAGMALGDLELPPNSFISLVIKESGPVTPSHGVVLDSGDDVVAVTTLDEEQLLYNTLIGGE